MTRFLLYFVGLLVLLNVAVLMWPDKASLATHVYMAKDDVNPHFVRLNKEIEDLTLTKESLSSQLETTFEKLDQSELRYRELKTSHEESLSHNIECHNNLTKTINDNKDLKSQIDTLELSAKELTERVLLIKIVLSYTNLLKINRFIITFLFFIFLS